MYRYLTLDEIHQQIFEKHGNVVKIRDKTYISVSKKATFIDCDYGEWVTKVNIVLSGHGHTKRGRQKTFDSIRLTPNKITQHMKFLWDGVATFDESTYVNRETPARFIDKDYGEWWVKPLHVMGGTGRHPKRARANTVSSRKLFIDTINDRIRKVHGDNIIMCLDTYCGTRKKAKFIDKQYGEWWTSPSSVMSGRGHPAGKLKKAIMTMRSFKSVKHWKTNEICYPASGFEYAVLVWLCMNKYDFGWQIPIQLPMLTPKLKRSVIYNVDCFIKSGPFANTFIEIKGTWSRRQNNDGGYAKWEWFHANYPNSQLWMRKDLIKLNIIDDNRSYLEKARLNDKN